MMTAGSPTPLAHRIVDLVGGSQNIARVTHCMVRLRFELVDPDLADDAALQALPDVLVVVRQSGQLQLALRIPVTTAIRDVRCVLETEPDRWNP